MKVGGGGPRRRVKVGGGGPRRPVVEDLREGEAVEVCGLENKHKSEMKGI